MHPILIDFGTFDLPLLGRTHLFLPTYGFLFALSVLVAWYWFMRRARTFDIAEERLFNLTFFTLLAGVLGAKLLLIIVDWRFYLQNPGEILGTLRAAGVLMGGVVCGALTFALYARRQGMPVWSLADAIAAPLILAQAIGRLGCFSAGCCWGVPLDADHPLTTVFTDPQAQVRADWLGRPLLATQLLEMSFDLLVCLLLVWLWRRRPEPPGTIFWIYVLLYSVGRGTIEFWRGDAQRGLYFGGQVSTSQIVAVLGVLLATVFLVRGIQFRRRADTVSA